MALSDRAPPPSSAPKPPALPGWALMLIVILAIGGAVLAVLLVAKCPPVPVPAIPPATTSDDVAPSVRGGGAM